MSNGVKILVVDDDQDLVESVRLILENAKYQVVVAPDASQGLGKAGTERPDLILLDVMMPTGTEGFHFVWELRRRKEEYFQKVPIIILTAIHDKTSLRFYPDSSDGTYRAGDYLPVQDFIDKPLNPDQLLEKVAAVLKSSAIGR